MARQQPEEFDPILDSIADGVFTVDKEWNITSFNRAAERITATRRRDALGRKCWEVFHADVCERDCLLKKTLKSSRQCVNRTVRIVNKHGVIVPISISTAILKNSRGEVIGGVETFRDLSEIEELRKEVRGRDRHSDIITADPRLRDLLGTLPVIAASESPVLIRGESGTGKELVARAIHQLSERSTGPFVAVNCGALPENLLESELFGVRKGAFTDARADRPGRFERARGGTLFLDEIGELPRSVQVKLLRVLQERLFEPLGAVRAIKADVRIVAATNRHLEAMLADGSFRPDLYYRINVVAVVLPPLRDRRGDVPLLTDHFVHHLNAINNRKIERLSAEALQVLLDYPFPGNVRELENILQHAFVLCRGSVIEKKHLPALLAPAAPVGGTQPASVAGFEKRIIEDALRRNHYSRSNTARELGIHAATLWRKMKRYSIDA